MPLRPRLRLLDRFWDFLLGDRPSFRKRAGASGRLRLEALESREVPTTTAGTLSITDHQTVAAFDTLVGYDTAYAVTFGISTGPSHGTVSLDDPVNGCFTYTANALYYGPDSFGYEVDNGHGGTAYGTVTVDVTDAAPTASGTDIGSAPAGVAQSGSLAGLTSDADNVYDPPVDAVTVSVSTAPAHGTVTLAPGGDFTYTPATGYAGPDSFWYAASDGMRAGAPAEVTLAVDQANTTTDLSANLTSVLPTDAVALTATVAATSDDPYAATPTGNVSFSDGSKALGAATLRDNGDGTATATLEVVALSVGDHGNLAAHYLGDTSHATSDSGTIDVVVNAPTPIETVPSAPACNCGCPNQPGSAKSAPAGIGLGLGGAPATVAPILFSDGVPQVASTDLMSDGFGSAWGVTRSWTSDPGAADPNAAFGNNEVVTQLPRLAENSDGSQVALVQNGVTSLTFALQGDGSFAAVGFDPSTLAYDSGTATFALIDGTGQAFAFHGFGGALPTAEQGTLISQTAPDGPATAVTYLSGGAVDHADRSETVGGVAYVERLAFAYLASGYNAGKVATVTMEQQTGGGSWQVVRSAAYTYYAPGDANGTPGDLELVEVKDPSGAVLETKYYRYYGFDDPNGPAGTLKYVVEGTSYARLAAAVSDPLTATDSAISPYADENFRYDAERRATQEIAQGTGCSSCAGGLGTFTMTYTSSANAPGYNAWATKTVEGLPDGNQNVVYTNAYGEVMLSAYVDTTTGQKWDTYYQFDDSGRVVLVANPSAVTGYDDSYADLVHFTSGNAQYLSDAAGLVTAYAYGATTTATATAAGDAAGYLSSASIRQGELGTAVPQEAWKYLSHAAGGATVYNVASDTAYRNADGTGAETTTTAYAYFTGTNRVQSATTTLPAVTAGENGPGTATATTVVYNADGQAVWSKDAAGFLSYAAYDPLTGAVVKSITDVDTTQTSEFTALPSGWSTPSGGGLNLVTADAVDAQGRTTKEVSPNGTVTYLVYDDANHEVRAYAGWNATTHTPTGPTQVSRDDWANGYTETFAMSAVPAVDGGGVPTGNETISGLQSLSRTHVNAAGQAVTQDDYFNLSGLTYSTGVMGTSGTNFYQTAYAYDHGGRLSKTVSPSGTIYRTVYDGQGRALSTWVGTHDTPTSGYWSPTNLAGTDMAETAAFIYDGGGVGDSNLTQVTDFTGSAAAPDRATQYAYDWRDRRVGEKDGATATETDGAHRPITVTAYDNLDEVTQTQSYDGDGLSLADGNGTLQVPAAGKLRSQAAAAYDELGQVYRTTAYSVDPATGNVAAGNLASNYWHDKRGNLIESSVPNGPVAKSAYDGAGRLTLAYATDGAGGTGYAAASSVASDTVLSQVGYGYDADGNVILTTSKDRLPNATGTGALGNATTGVYARVSYAANYYDAGDRPTASVNVGTNGGAAWTRPGSMPTGNDTVLVGGLTYGPDGGVQDATDPRGLVTRTTRDALGRTTASVEDFTGNGTPTSSSNKTTLYGYGPAGMTSLTAVNPGGANQTTAWAYGVTTAGGSKLNSNDIVGATEHPDPTTGNAGTSLQDTVTVDIQGQTLTATDRNGTTHSYSYDSLGRVTADAVTALGTGIDGAVRKVTTAYDGQGNAYLVTSLNGSNAAVNQVEDLFNGYGELSKEYQAVSGSVNVSTTPSVQYTYATTGNTDRLTGIVYPDGHTLNYNYASGVDAATSRLSNVTDGTGTLEAYTYMGLAAVVERVHPLANAKLGYVTVGSTGDAGDEVTGLDRFGRIVDQRWTNTTSNATLSDYLYGYDRGGNVLFKQDAVNGNFSQLYAYDNLNQLASYQEGTLNANRTALVGNATANQSWADDALGNWLSVTTGNATQTRTANAQNEYTAVGSATPAYNAAGDMITDETGKQFVYDAWNRLVAVKSAGNVTLETNGYDGTNRRDTTTAGGTTTDLLYSAAWQVLEEQVGGNFTQRYDWSPIYVDALIARDTDTSGTGLTAAGGNFTRLWPMQDANWNVTGVVDGTGAVNERYDYSPFGTVTVLTAVYGSRATTLYVWTVGFQGMSLDSVTGLNDQRERWYASSLGRWVTVDPLGLLPDTNDYRFVGNAPNNWVDPTGLEERHPHSFPGGKLDMRALDDALESIAQSKEADSEARRIAAAIRNTYNNNYRFVWPSARNERNSGYYCYEWAYSFENAFKAESSGKYFKVQVEGAIHQTDPDGRVHYWINISSLESKKSIYVDDGFTRNRNFVHSERPAIDNYKYHAAMDALHPKANCENMPTTYNAKNEK